MAMGLNLSGTFSLFRLLRDPALCLPHSTVPTFNHLPHPLSSAFATQNPGARKVDIRAVVLDKDNCFAAPKADHVYGAYKDRFEQLRREFPGARLLIVSNTAGSSADPTDVQSQILQSNTGVAVLRHSSKKPGCWPDIVKHFQSHPETKVTCPAQIAVVGDRLFTDVMTANLMGSYSIWIRDGVEINHSRFSRLEKTLSAFLLKRGYHPPEPCQDAFLV